MKNFKSMFGCALIVCGAIGIIACAIAGCVFSWQHIDMTEMRKLLEYPWPTVWCVINYISIQVGLWIVKKS